MTARSSHTGFTQIPANRRKTTGLVMAGVLTCATLALTGCGSSQTTKNPADAAARAAYAKTANGICTVAVAAIHPVAARMAAIEKTKHLPTLADQKAVFAAQAALQHDLAAIPVPASLASTKAGLDTAFAGVVARVSAIATRYKAEAIAYVAIDKQIAQLSSSLDAQFKAAGLTSCY